ncbi:carbon storage regulator, CsrA [Amphibacillus marinus]|uniref:Translational regulator CsrA n=1 Tax=Amphibacillus marinus TaxID=872970 RepID=A0A1H8QY69_9BACI|nr:carbon storage regulator CsrA [Amphibacillus marinus]SEO59249.1 carbon storage regulator, CsrA [Amphibacillus marinus]
MLVLTRKLKQKIQIGDEIEIEVLAIDGEQIKLGITAPKEIDVHRHEIYQAIIEENTKAASVPSSFGDFLK